MGYFESGVMLNLLIYAPLVLGCLCLMLPERLIRHGALISTLVTLVLSIIFFGQFDPSGPDFQSTIKVPWIPGLGIHYELGIDGVSLVLILLTTALMPLAVLASYTAIENRVREYYFFLLALETAIIGAFCALDIFLFYVFWEAMLIPMYFLIGIWGGKSRIYAAMKFFIYTFVGSLLMLVAIFTMAFMHKAQFGDFSMSLSHFSQLNIPGGGFFTAQNLLFLAFAVAFAVKVPLFPLHTWLPDAHVQAPTAGSVILAGILLKLGGYGFIRFAFPLFPDAVHYFQYSFMLLSAIAIIYGALIAFMQTDIKKLVAYSSVSHMGYVVLGLFALNMTGFSGAMFQMVSHGLATGGLFLLVGMIYERRHTREISAFGGIAKKMPVYTVAFMFMTLASVGLPGTSGFIGEFLILLGSWQAEPVLTIFATTGVILGAVYMLWLMQKMFFGKSRDPENDHLKDLNGREIVIMLPLMIGVVVFGLFPNQAFNKFDAALVRLHDQVSGQTEPAQEESSIEEIIPENPDEELQDSEPAMNEDESTFEQPESQEPDSSVPTEEGSTL